ncbi:hypothetical protein KAI87_05130 [Myxococcota bacterium]|nr:hypothetical protein [Myxococcota bacterium]
MQTLKSILLTPENRPTVIQECVALIDREVANKRGLTGVAVKGAYGIVKKVKPSIISEATSRLLDPFVEKMEPFFKDALDAKSSVESYFGKNSTEVANALLGVTDARIDDTETKIIKKTYAKLRPSGLKHTSEAVPAVGELIDRWLAKS